MAEAFTPTSAEVGWAWSCIDDEHYLLALVVWLKSYQRLGCLPKLAEVPSAMAGHVRQVLGLADDEVAVRQAASASAKRHRALVRKRLGAAYEAARVRRVAEASLRRAVQSTDNPADLIKVALEELVRAVSCRAAPRWTRWPPWSARRSTPGSSGWSPVGWTARPGPGWCGCWWSIR
ncbi:DUF4158 domain-containing protein [Actinomadura coerulea]|uniref:DUF4158 domain-containing protein n=1 Tax=Actinomadura coerulea TaxID=46159 RepID=UPI00344A14B4